jgi:hypothetical protein
MGQGEGGTGGCLVELHMFSLSEATPKLIMDRMKIGRGLHLCFRESQVENQVGGHESIIDYV